MNEFMAKLRAFVEQASTALPPPEDRLNDASEYEYEVLEDLVTQARDLLANWAEDRTNTPGIFPGDLIK